VLPGLFDFDSFLPPACDQGQELRRFELIKILNSKGEILPAADSPLRRLWSLVSAENRSLDQCAAVIALDPALTTRIFRVANSTAYGGHATRIFDAVFHLGFARIREVAFNATVLEQFSQYLMPLTWNHFWLRNIFVGYLAERIATIYFPSDGAEYLSGLLHDVGWLFMANFFPNEFKNILWNSRSVGDAELEMFSLTHANISAAICARSYLPPKLVNAIALHHSSLSIEPESLRLPNESALLLAIILNICDQLADYCQLEIIKKENRSLDDILESPEARYLRLLDPYLPLQEFIDEEMPKAREIFSIFFLK
jgi:HD-like signal output (HDOD) protein